MCAKGQQPNKPNMPKPKIKNVHSELVHSKKPSSTFHQTNHDVHAKPFAKATNFGIKLNVFKIEKITFSEK